MKTFAVKAKVAAFETCSGTPSASNAIFSSRCICSSFTAAGLVVSECLQKMGGKRQSWQSARDHNDEEELFDVEPSL